MSNVRWTRTENERWEIGKERERLGAEAEPVAEIAEDEGGNIVNMRDEGLMTSEKAILLGSSKFQGDMYLVDDPLKLPQAFMS